MASKFKKGDLVKVNAVVPSGEVQALRMDDEGTVLCLLEWVDRNGATQKRWIPEDELITA
jgi:uncharacterized protein YodC (DUF2158 family)